MDKKLEGKFKNRLEKETEEITELKEETWNNISRELFREKDKKTRINWMKGFAAALGTVAVAAIMFFVFVTGDFTDETQNDPVQNDPTEDEVTEGTNDPDTEDKDIGEDTGDNEIDSKPPLKDRFPHEKEVEIEVEGDKETIQVQLATNDEWGYIIYFDKDLFKFIQGEEMDKIVFTTDPVEGYPEVSVEIQKITGLSREEVVTNIKESLASDGMSIIREEEIDRPIDGLIIVGEGSENGVVDWDTPDHSYYITEGANDSLFVFKHISFVEARDGGPRFYHMLESFEIVE